MLLRAVLGSSGFGLHVLCPGTWCMSPQAVYLLSQREYCVLGLVEGASGVLYPLGIPEALARGGDFAHICNVSLEPASISWPFFLPSPKWFLSLPQLPPTIPYLAPSCCSCFQTSVYKLDPLVTLLKYVLLGTSLCLSC